jgi:uracil-DNA glycosylase family 4
MHDWLKYLDPATVSLMRKAARAQLELGVADIVVNKKSVDTIKINLESSGMLTKARRKKKYKSLEEHEKAIGTCRNCPLGDSRTHFVYGVGNPHADVMFIGEAPGREEDLKGEPFVGRAGQLLDRILAAIDFRREDVYIANILKCRPPGNRDPLPEEIESCMPYLLVQIELIKPKIICALGRIAAQALLDTSTPLGKLRRRWHEFNGIPFMVTYHPAALLRFQAYKKDCWEDVKMLRKKYDEIMGAG